MTQPQLHDWTEASRKRNIIQERYEPIQPYIAFELAQRIRATVVLDVGANIGFYSVVLGSLESVESIFSFEPMPTPFRELNENIGLNGLANKAKLFQLAASDSRSEVIVNVYGESSGANSIAATSIHKNKTPIGKIAVQTDTIDHLIPVQGVAAFIKIDVEGHEFEALTGANKFFTSNKGVLQVEIYSDNQSDGDIRNWLNNLGWEEFFSAGPDIYFSNIPEIVQADSMVDVMKVVSQRLIDRKDVKPRRGGAQRREDAPIKRQLLPGLSIEITGSLSRRLRKLFKSN